MSRNDPFLAKSHELVELGRAGDGILGSWSAATVAAAHKFVFGRHTAVPEAFVRFGDDLVLRGIFRLPFQFTVMEFLLGPPEDDARLDRLVLLCEAVDMGRPGRWEDVPPIIVTVFPIVRSRDGVWTPVEYGGEPLAIGTGCPPPDGRPLQIPPIYETQRGGQRWRLPP